MSELLQQNSFEFHFTRKKMKVLVKGGRIVQKLTVLKQGIIITKKHGGCRKIK